MVSPFIGVPGPHAKRPHTRVSVPLASVVPSTRTMSCATTNDLPPKRAMRERTSQRSPCSAGARSEEHTSELQSLAYLVCRLLLEKKKKRQCLAPCRRVRCNLRL